MKEKSALAVLSAGICMYMSAGLTLADESSLDVTGESDGRPLRVEVAASRISQIGLADSASQGVVTQQQLAARTVYRPGELLESTPGLIVSQHSGEGKANQFYLRGFNLDHGTDLRTMVDAMPVNQRSHAHGQGWTDVNFMIPELATRLEYRKGPYYADEGDFASAGAVSVRYADRLPEGIVSIGIGQYGYRRTLLAASPKAGNGNLLYALELLHNDGPFTQGDDYRKINGVLRYSEGTISDGFHVAAMLYHGSWHATDQIPQRAIDSEVIANRFSAIDPTDGGMARRISISGQWRASSDTTSTAISAYVIRNQLDLYSNFTYFLDEPVHGDQFNQPDRRVTSGVDASKTWQSDWFGRAVENRTGVQFQNDNIFNGLYQTEARQRLATTRADHILETSMGVYFENALRWSEHLRSTAGLRGDYYHFDVSSTLAANSGVSSAAKLRPNLGLVFGPWQRNELYFNLGSGFHSNDARGTTISVDPKSGAAVDKVTPLAGSKGVELGLRSELVPGLQSAFSLYRLDFDSELTFAGDAGTTQAGRPSRRLGFEFSNYYKPRHWLTIDADLAFARARFRDVDPVGEHIPGAVEGVASLALAFEHLGPWFGALQLRYFGPRPLIEDDSVRSKATATLNGRLGYHLSPKLKLELDAYNLSNRIGSAIDYYYTSRLSGEATAGVNDIHFHPIESRSARVTLTAMF